MPKAIQLKIKKKKMIRMEFKSLGNVKKKKVKQQ